MIATKMVTGSEVREVRSFVEGFSIAMFVTAILGAIIGLLFDKKVSIGQAAVKDKTLSNKKQGGRNSRLLCYLRKLAVSIRLSALESFASASISSASVFAAFLRSSAAFFAASARATSISSAHSHV